MRLSNVILLVSCCVVLAAEDPHHIEDACGDSDVYVQYQGDRTEVPDVTRPGGFDIAGVSFADAYAGEGPDQRHIGIDVVLELCDDVPEPRAQDGAGAWGVRWEVTDDCDRTVLVDDAYYVALPPDAGVGRVGVLMEQCAVDGPGGLYGTYEITAEVEVTGATTIDGRVITWRLRGADLGALGEAVAEDEVLRAPRGFTTGGVPGLTYATLPFENSAISLLFGDDGTATGADVVVGGTGRTAS